METKKFMAGIIAGIVLIAVVMSAGCVSTDAPSGQEQVKGVNATVDSIPAEVIKGDKFMVSGTAVGATGKSVTVVTTSETDTFKNTKVVAVGADGKWWVEMPQLDVGKFKVDISIEGVMIGSQKFSVKKVKPTVTQFPGEITVGPNDITIFGSAISNKRETITIDFKRNTLDLMTTVFPAHTIKTTTVGPDGRWWMEMPTELIVGNYTVSFMIGDSTFAQKELEVVSFPGARPASWVTDNIIATIFD